MLSTVAPLSEKSRLAVLLDHFAKIDDPRDIRRITHPVSEVVLLVVCEPLPTAMTTTTSPPGARRIWTFCVVIRATKTESPGALADDPDEPD